MKLILASLSPRRKDILTTANIPFRIIPPQVEESFDQNLPIHEAVKQTALIKAQSVFDALDCKSDTIVLGCDTIVVVDSEVIRKPRDYEEAFKSLRKLSGRSHVVMSGCALVSSESSETFVVETIVEFSEMTDDDIIWYLSVEDVYDKSGSYAIQGPIKKFVKRIDGDINNVVGLPIEVISKKVGGKIS